MELVRTRTYERGLKRRLKLGATDLDIRAMEDAIAHAPKIGDVIPGSGGLRKVRFGYGDAGKSGGGRTTYVLTDARNVTYLLIAYAKVDREDVSSEVLRQLRALARELTQ